MWRLRNGTRDFMWCLFWSVFEKPGQWATFLFGFFFLVAGALLFPLSRPWLGFFSAALSGIGCSVLASGLVVRLLQAAILSRNAKSLERTGVFFVGNRESFDRNHGPKEISGWDCWIGETARKGQIIICGKKNGKWIEKSSDELKRAIERPVTIEFVFLGTQSEIRDNVKAFQRMAVNEGIWDSLEGRLSEYVTDSTHPTGDDCGFYWNGKTLMVKVYPPGVSNENSPIIGFDTSFAGREFDPDDFDRDCVPFKEGDALMHCAQGLKEIWRKKVLLDQSVRD